MCVVLVYSMVHCVVLVCVVRMYSMYVVVVFACCTINGHFEVLLSYKAQHVCNTITILYNRPGSLCIAIKLVFFSMYSAYVFILFLCTIISVLYVMFKYRVPCDSTVNTTFFDFTSFRLLATHCGSSKSNWRDYN